MNITLFVYDILFIKKQEYFLFIYLFIYLFISSGVILNCVWMFYVDFFNYTLCS